MYMYVTAIIIDVLLYLLYMIC